MIPQVGLGTCAVPLSFVKPMVLEALNAGYQHIDCAEMYNNEQEIGNALAEFFKTHDRSKVFVTSKVWNHNHTTEKLHKTVMKSLKDLQLEYLDLYILHWPINTTVDPPRNNYGQLVDQNIVPHLENGYPIQKVWRDMEALVRQGLVRNIGVSNFSNAALMDLLNYCEIKPLCNQVEVQPFFQNLGVVDFCHQNGVSVVAYSPLGGSYGEVANIDIWRKDPLFIKMQEKYHKTLGQLILRWHLLKHPKLFAVIPRSSSLERIRNNFDLGFDLQDEDFKYIDSLDLNRRGCGAVEYVGVPMFD